MDLLRQPDKFELHFERYAASVVMTVSYARRVDDMQDPAVTMIMEVMNYWSTLNIPGRRIALLGETPRLYLTLETPSQSQFPVLVN
jgi:hypothetical protein